MKNLETVRTEVRENSLIIYLSREERMNAFTLTMQQEIVKVLDDAEENDDIKAIIFTGDGKAYCAGADLSSGGDTFDNRKGRERTNDVVRDSGGLLTLRLFKCKKPLIAAVNGVAMGGGFEIALACDLIVAAENAVFSLPEPRVGLAALGGGIHRLPREIGIKKAMGMLLTGRRVSAQEGKDLGFVNQVSRKNSVLDTAKDWAGLILECAPLSVRASKEAAMLGMNASGIEDAIKSRYKQVQLMQKSSDFVEGLSLIHI